MESKGKKNFYEYLCVCLSEKFMALFGSMVFLVLMLPVFYLSFINRASGDDYGYSVATRAAWVSSHSLAEVFKASVQTTRQSYYSWQGTWFSIFCFSMQPEVFGERAYAIVTFLMLFLLFGSTIMLFYQIFRKGLDFGIWSVLLIALIHLVSMTEFIPGIRSAFFWYNGAMHYMMPFAMCQILCTWLLLYIRTWKKRYLAGITLIMILLGGSNYQAALFAVIAAVYAVIYGILSGKRVSGQKKNFVAIWLLVPILLELPGFIISMRAPGNKVRGGTGFGFSVSKGFSAVGMSFVSGIRDIISYIVEKPVIWIGFLALFLLLTEAFLRQRRRSCPKHPFLICAGLFCLYSAMQAPAVYADVEVSNGVYNMNYQVFLLMMLGILTILADKMAGALRKVKKGQDTARWTHAVVVLPGLLICVILLWLCRGSVKQSTSYQSLVYITSGQAADYKEQMELQTRLLTDKSVSDVVVPFINDDQGPLMHMPVTENPEAWTNTVTREFYGKKSVKAIPRVEWMELYGKEELP